jgi:hypothetical protein
VNIVKRGGIVDSRIDTWKSAGRLPDSFNLGTVNADPETADIA